MTSRRTAANNAPAAFAALNPDPRPADGTDLDERAEQLFAQIVTGQLRLIQPDGRRARRRTRQSATPRRPLSRRLALGGAASAGLAAVAIVVTAVLPVGSGLTGPSVAAAAVLRQAQAAASTSAPVPNGKYLYTRSDAVDLHLVACLLPGECNSHGYLVNEAHPHGYTVDTVTEIWADSDARGWLKTTNGSPTFRPGDLAAFQRSGQPVPQGGGNLDESLSDAPAALVASPAGWPTDPRSLKAAIAQRYEGGKPDAGATFDFATEILQVATQPDLRAALYGVLLTLPDIQSGGSASDRLGRIGQSLSLTHFGVQVSIVIDTSNGQLLGRKVVLKDPAADPGPAYRALPAGTILSDEVFDNPTIADSIPDDRQ